MPAEAPLLINETASLPRGLYRRTGKPMAPGAIVAFQAPPRVRAYLAGLGASPRARLLKRVAATGGEVVCRNGSDVTWPRGAVTALTFDRRGRSLPVWRGCRRLAEDEVFVLGDTALSFDSRYFGPVGRAAADGAYREVWRW
jgi:type IV secretory pathway protease TraF